MSAPSLLPGQSGSTNGVPFISQITPSSLTDSDTAGGAGATITILGANFPSNAVVNLSYCGQSCTLNPSSTTVNASGSQIVAQFSYVPQGVMTFNITVTNPNGSSPSTSNVVYLPETNATPSVALNLNTTNWVSGTPQSLAVEIPQATAFPGLAILSQMSDIVWTEVNSLSGFQPSYPMPTTGQQPWGIVTGQFVRGGTYLGLAVTNSYDNTVTVFAGTCGSGCYQQLSSTSLPGVFPTGVVPGDFNRDGILDLAVVNTCGSQSPCFPQGVPFGPGSVTILLGNGDGTFTASSMQLTTGGIPYVIATGDLNGDGILDLVVANSSSNNLSIFMGNGDGTFTPATALPVTGNNPTAIVLGDFNSDGLLDIAVTNGNDNTVSILLNQNCAAVAPAACAFASAAVLPVGSGPLAMAAGDMNGDGFLDLVVANVVASTVSVLLGDGAGHFQPAAPQGSVGFSTGMSPDGIVLADFDDDGRLDIATSNRSGSYSFLRQASVVPLLLAVNSPLPTVYGDSLSLTAYLGPQGTARYVPNGTATLLDGVTPITSAPLGGSYQAQFILPTGYVPGAGTHQYSAVFGGDSNYARLTSETLTIPLAVAQTTTTLTSNNVGNVQYGQSVTLTAKLNLFAPATGTVTFSDTLNSTTLGVVSLSNNAAQLSVSNLQLGQHFIQASYSGDANCTPSNSAILSLTISQGATTTINLTASPSQAQFGQPVFLTALLQYTGSTAPTGTIAFFDGSTSLGTMSAPSNAAVLSIATLSLGTHTISAQYSGDSNYLGSSGTVTVTIVPSSTATIVSSSLNPSAFGQAVVFSASVKPAFGPLPAGQLSFYDGASLLQSVNTSNGSGQITISSLGGGTHSITAQYSTGSSNYSASTSPALVQTIQPSATTLQLASTPDPSFAGQPVALSATLASANGLLSGGGTITFYDSGAVLGSGTIGISSNAVTLSIGLGAGSHALSATYSGDSNLRGSTSPTVLQAVNLVPSMTSLTSSVNPVVSGQAVTFTAAIQSPGSSIVGGTVAFLDGTTTLGSANISNGSAQFTVTLGVGSHSVTASYPGIAGAIAGSVSPAIVEVVNAPAVAPGGFFVRGGTKRMTTAAVSMQPSYNAQPQQGDLLVAYVWWNSSTATISSVTDNCNNTWVATPAQLDSVDGAQAQLFYVAGSKLCNASATLTVTFSSAVIGRAVLGDWSGMGAGAVYFDAGATNFSTATTTPSSNVSTNNMQDLIIQVAAGDNSNGVFTSAGGFKNRVSSIGMVMADSTVSTAQNYSASLTDNVTDNILSGVFGFELTTAPAFPVQSSLNAATSTSISCSYPQNVRAGDVLAAYVWWPQNNAVTMSVADNINGAWLPAGGQATETGTPHSSQLFYLANTAAGAVTITATPSNGASQQLYMECTELSGMATSNVLDGTPATAFSAKGSTSLNVGPVTTSNADDLLLLGCSTNAGNGFKVPSGFMQLQEINHALLMVGPASSAGSYSTTCSGGGALYTGNLAAFQ